MYNIFLNPVSAAQEKVRSYVESLGIAYKNPLMSFTNLRIHANLINSTTNYELRFEEAAGTNGDDQRERKLRPQDFFLPMFMAIWLEKYDPNGNNGSQPSFPYVDENYFSYANGGVTEAEGLRLIYSGDTTFEMHSKDNLRKLDNSDYQVVPDHQYLPAAVAGQANAEYPEFGPSMAQRGYQPLYPMDLIKGNDGSKLQLNLGKGTNTLIEGDPGSGLKNRVVFSIKGWWVTGYMGSEETRLCRVS